MPALAALVLALLGLPVGSIGAQAVRVAPAALSVEDATGHAVNPLAPGDDVRVFVFTRRDCPIGNRYAPELARLARSFGVGATPATAAPVTVWLVYVDGRDTSALIADHQREYNLDIPWLVDRSHGLADASGATVTPEAAVYSPAPEGVRRLLYRGRIDDRVESVGRVRPAATTHDLADAIEAARRGRMPAPAAGPAIGCFIADAQ